MCLRSRHFEVAVGWNAGLLTRLGEWGVRRTRGVVRGLDLCRLLGRWECVCYERGQRILIAGEWRVYQTRWPIFLFRSQYRVRYASWDVIE